MVANIDKPTTQNVPTPMTDELIEKLDIMAGKKEQSRAGFIRLLVREAYEEFVRAEAYKRNLLKTTLKHKAVAK